MPGLTDDAIRRTAEAVRWVERQKQQTGQGVKPVQTPIPFQFRRFELKEDLAPGGSAEAYFLDSDDAIDETRAPFTVTDVKGKWRGRARDKFSSTDNQKGSQGTCYHPHDVDRWEITDMQPHALMIRGTLPATLAATASTLTINSVVVMEQPGALITDQDPAGSITVYNVPGLVGSSGDSVRAVWNEDAVRWELVDSHDGPFYAKAQADWTETSTINPTVSCKRVTDETGGTEVGDTLTVLLPRKRAKSVALDPSVYSGDVILVEKSDVDNVVCLTPYLFSAIGDIKETGVGGKIPTGWEILSAAVHRVTLQVDTGGESNEGTVGGTGGYRWHGDHTTGDPGDNNHPDHPEHEHPPGAVTNSYDSLGTVAANSGGFPKNVPTEVNGEHDHAGAVAADGDHDHDIVADVNESWSALAGEDESAVDQRVGVPGGTEDLRNHLGPFKDDKTTDNRMPFFVVQRLIRVK